MTNTETADSAGEGGELKTAKRVFRWEDLCLSDDPFAGDFGGSCDGDSVLSDKMVTNRKGGTCHNCRGECERGTRNRVRTEVYDGELMRFRWCQTCCFAMAVYDIRPSIAERLIAIGTSRNVQGAAS